MSRRRDPHSPTGARKLSRAAAQGAASIRGREAALHLTFDDGPDVKGTPAVLDRLDAADATATFFVMPGGDAGLIAEVDARGHEVAYHCGKHVRHTDRTRDEVRTELHGDLEVLAGAGIVPRAWRTPWGDLAPWTAELAASAGLRLWGWSDDTEDWAGHGAGSMLERLALSLSGGSVVLMHDGIGPGSRRSDCTNTIALVEPLCELGRARGLELRALSGEVSDVRDTALSLEAR